MFSVPQARGLSWKARASGACHPKASLRRVAASQSAAISARSRARGRRLALSVLDTFVLIPVGSGDSSHLVRRSRLQRVEHGRRSVLHYYARRLETRLYVQSVADSRKPAMKLSFYLSHTGRASRSTVPSYARWVWFATHFQLLG